MQALIEVVAPIFLILGAGYAAVWRGLLTADQADTLMAWTQSFAIPCLLFSAIATLDLAQNLQPRLFVAFYTGALAGFVTAGLGARYLFGRAWDESVAIGFCGLFSNSLMLGLAITERAFGAAALTANFAIIAVHAPFCYVVGITAMELVRGKGGTGRVIAQGIARALIRNPLVIALLLGFAINVSGITLPGVLADALTLISRSAIPVALFGLGAVLHRYRPDGDLRIVAMVCAASLVLHPAVVWGTGTLLALPQDQFRSAVVTAAVAPGVNAYVFASMYGVGQRVAASAVLIGTGLAFVTVWGWLALLGAG